MARVTVNKSKNPGTADIMAKVAEELQKNPNVQLVDGDTIDGDTGEIITVPEMEFRLPNGRTRKEHGEQLMRELDQVVESNKSKLAKAAAMNEPPIDPDEPGDVTSVTISSGGKSVTLDKGARERMDRAFSRDREDMRQVFRNAFGGNPGDRYPVPNVDSFEFDPFLKSPELTKLGDDLARKWDVPTEARIVYRWKEKGGSTAGKA